jgi:hypothetical protein
MGSCSENQGLAAWKAYSGNGNMPWFDYRMDALPSKNPDREILSKMKQIAKSLRAKVLGDDGEEY